MEQIDHQKYLARVVQVTASKVIAEFNPDLHLPLPAFGSLVKIENSKNRLYGLISDARIKGESQLGNDDFFSNPIPTGTEIHIIPVGTVSRENPSSLPVQDMASGLSSHGDYVFMPTEDELQLFTIDLGFLKVLLAHPDPAAEELIVITIRKFSNVYPDRQSFMIRVMKELSRLTFHDRDVFQRILERTRTSYSENLSA